MKVCKKGNDSEYIHFDDLDPGEAFHFRSGWTEGRVCLRLRDNDFEGRKGKGRFCILETGQYGYNASGRVERVDACLQIEE